MKYKYEQFNVPSAGILSTGGNVYSLLPTLYSLLTNVKLILHR
ncbi:hypothetical protein [Okeania sp. SIO3B5]|nr:hypothetical protein [Okeania sp. SIO3B5]